MKFVVTRKIINSCSLNFKKHVEKTIMYICNLNVQDQTVIHVVLSYRFYLSYITPPPLFQILTLYLLDETPPIV